MDKIAADKLLIGAHTSIAGGVHHALLEGKRIGATTVQIFTANQRRWEAKPLDQHAIDLWKKTTEESGIHTVMSHDSYLINLGAADPEIYAKSYKAFCEELIRCQQLRIAFLNFHPGSFTCSSEEECLDRIVQSLLMLEKILAHAPHSPRLLIEATAGQGSSVGHRFEHLSYILERIQNRIKAGICLDTCHLFASGYDLRTEEACRATFEEFDRIVGLENLYAFHLNDSAKPLGSRVDRHASLGKGFIGLECFHFLMRDAKLRQIPKYLETPEGAEVWTKEIEMLRGYAAL